jgi:anti-anti-sigma factor
VGRVDSATAPKLAETFEKLAGESRFKLVLDLTAAEYMSSAGFRALVATQKECKRMGRGELVLCGVPKLIHEAFELTGMTTLFVFFNDQTSAVGHF